MWPIAAVGKPGGLGTAVRSRRFSSWPSLWTGLRNAGAEAVEQEVVTDGQFTTSRSPADLPAFCPAIIQQFARTLAPG
jgi:protease I